MNITVDTVNAFLNFAGGFLAFLGVIVGIAYPAIQKDQTGVVKQHIEKVLMTLLSLGALAASAVAWTGYQKYGLGLAFIGLFTLLNSIDFLRSPGRKLEILALVFHWALFGLFSLAYVLAVVVVPLIKVNVEIAKRITQ